MPQRNIPDALMLKAVVVRLGGGSWAAVGQAVGRSARTVESWPVRNRRQWEQAVEYVEPAFLFDAAAEGLLTLRRLVRSDDEKVRKDAAARLLNYRVAVLRLLRPRRPADPPAEEPTDWDRAARLLKGKTHDDADALVARCRG